MKNNLNSPKIPVFAKSHLEDTLDPIKDKKEIWTNPQINSRNIYRKTYFGLDSKNDFSNTRKTNSSEHTSTLSHMSCMKKSLDKFNMKRSLNDFYKKWDDFDTKKDNFYKKMDDFYMERSLNDFYVKSDDFYIKRDNFCMKRPVKKVYAKKPLDKFYITTLPSSAKKALQSNNFIVKLTKDKKGSGKNFDPEKLENIMRIFYVQRLVLLDLQIKAKKLEIVLTSMQIENIQNSIETQNNPGKK